MSEGGTGCYEKEGRYKMRFELRVFLTYLLVGVLRAVDANSLRNVGVGGVFVVDELSSRGSHELILGTQVSSFDDGANGRGVGGLSEGLSVHVLRGDCGHVTRVACSTKLKMQMVSGTSWRSDQIEKAAYLGCGPSSRH